MDLTEIFNGLESQILGLDAQMRLASERKHNDTADIAEIDVLLNNVHQQFVKCNQVLDRQKDASVKAAAAMKEFTGAFQRYLWNKTSDKHSNFKVGGDGGSGGGRNKKNLEQLTQTVKETLKLLETLQTKLAETIANSQEGSQLSAMAQNSLTNQREEQRKKQEKKKREEEKKRQEEEKRKREKENRKREEEKKRKLEAEKKRRISEARKKQAEEAERKHREEEERKHREEEERKHKEEAERKHREEVERKNREEEERKHREEEERKHKEEEERKHREEEERKQREEEEWLRMVNDNKQKREREKAEAERLKLEEATRQKREAEEQKIREEEEERQLREEERGWPAVLFPVRDSVLDSEHGCAIRAPSGALISDEFRCVTVPNLINSDSFPLEEEVVGNVIRLEAIGRSELGGSVRGRQVQWFVSLPHCAQRVSGRETVLYSYKNDSWEKLPTEEINSDSMPQKHYWVETRIIEPMVILVPVNRCKIEQAEGSMDRVEWTERNKTACLIVRQSGDYSKAMVALPSKQKVQAALAFMSSKGFTKHAISPQQKTELNVKERQMLEIKLTGNISSEEGEEFNMRFHSQINKYILLTLLPKDPSLPQHGGFLEAFNKLESMIIKIPLQLEKPQSEIAGPQTPRTIRAPFVFRANDAVTKEYLQSLAVDVQHSWTNLADRLGLTNERCSAIRAGSCNPTEQALEMLLAWLKDTTVSDNKANILEKALRDSGYDALACELLAKQQRLMEPNKAVDDNEDNEINEDENNETDAKDENDDNDAENENDDDKINEKVDYDDDKKNNQKDDTWDSEEDGKWDNEEDDKKDDDKDDKKDDNEDDKKDTEDDKKDDDDDDKKDNEEDDKWDSEEDDKWDNEEDNKKDDDKDDKKDDSEDNKKDNEGVKKNNEEDDKKDNEEDDKWDSEEDDKLDNEEYDKKVDDDNDKKDNEEDDKWDSEEDDKKVDDDNDKKDRGEDDKEGN